MLADTFLHCKKIFCNSNIAQICVSLKIYSLYIVQTYCIANLKWTIDPYDSE